jgi:hypothetical protein
MRRSEIFESFVKIAEEKGLVSKSSPEENIADLSKSHRADSLSVDDIAHLYGVKPPAPEDAQYQRNIIERAHPNPLVTTPSYDKLNSLIENNNERQDILLHIVNKNNDGSIVQRKYAERELILSLVRVGNEMDNRGQDELRALADVCLRQSSPGSISKQAQLQVIIPVIGAIIGGLYAKQHLQFHSDGFDADYEKAINELDDLLSSNSNLMVGYDYKPEFIATVNDIKNKLNELNTAYKAVLPHLDKLEMPRTGPELLQMAKTTDSHEALHALQEFKKVVSEVGPYLQKVVLDFSNEGYKERQIAHKGFLSQMVDSTEVLHGGSGLIADDFDDVVHALQTVFSDIKGIQKALIDADTKAAADTAKLQASVGTMSPTEPETTSVPLPSAREVGRAPVSPVEEVQTRTLEQELEENPDLEGFEG